jgi:hypothetical protein
MIANKANFTDEQIIKLLGGTKKVSHLCNKTHSAVIQWQSRGIPYAQICFLAAEIERQSNELVTRKDLFPKSWHLVWPELQETEQ